MRAPTHGGAQWGDNWVRGKLEAGRAPEILDDIPGEVREESARMRNDLE